jgi:hypothetical protein
MVKAKIVSIERAFKVFFLMMFGILSYLVNNLLQYTGFRMYFNIFCYFFIGYVFLYYLENNQSNCDTIPDNSQSKIS